LALLVGFAGRACVYHHSFQLFRADPLSVFGLEGPVFLEPAAYSFRGLVFPSFQAAVWKTLDVMAGLVIAHVFAGWVV